MLYKYDTKVRRILELLCHKVFCFYATFSHIVERIAIQIVQLQA